MSMNLNLRVDGVNVDLWQTPTYITYMCLMTSKGQKAKLEGKKAVRAIFMYFEWCKSIQGGSMNTKNHMRDVLRAINASTGSIEVYMS
jgi:hypothetical protein